MHKQDGVFLIGPMGAGKTSVGRELAAQNGKSFLDTDAKIIAGNQLSITQIFTQYGEAYFRQQEAACIEKVTQIPSIVLATGGGCIDNAATRKVLRERGVVVYLKVSEQQQRQRLAHASDRPLLSKLSGMQYREQFYSEIANVVVHTDRISIREVVNLLVTELEKLDACYSSRVRA